MEYVRGESLSKLAPHARASRARTCPPRIAASIMCGVLHGLHAAHEAKNERGEPLDIVHRDVSPQNVLVGADGIARVLDFGIAKAAGRIQVTRDGQIKGKLAYMPPEQLRGASSRARSTSTRRPSCIWETLTGERLFKGETEGETLAKILRDPVIPPSTVVAGLPRAFDAPLLKALSREASKRHATARELAFDLEKCVGVASASEVGEWVESMVGSILSAREDTIAEIESNSASLRVKQDVESDSDSNGVAVQHAHHAGTMVGIGPPSGTMPMAHARRIGSQTVTETSASSVRSPATDETTGSKVTGSRFTGTMSLPVNRRLPIVASALGLLVLLTIMGVVLLGRGPDPVAGLSPSASASGSAAPGSASGSGTPAASTVVTASSGASEQPPPPSSVAAVDSAQPGVDIKPVVTTHTSPPVHATFRPPVTAPPPRTATPAPAPVRKNCDPPYTIDSNGRKKYKLECM